MEPTTTELPVIFARRGEAGGCRIDAARPWMQTVKIGIKRGDVEEGKWLRFGRGVMGVLLILYRALERSRCRSSGRVSWDGRHAMAPAFSSVQEKEEGLWWAGPCTIALGL